MVSKSSSKVFIYKMNEARAFNKNLKALGLAQTINFLYPLLALPLIGRELGTSSFGVLMSSYALVLMASTAVDYGFNFEGPRLAGERESDNKSLAELYFSVLSVKLSIAILVVTIFLLCRAVFLNAEDVYFSVLSIIMLPALLGAAINPQWLLLSIGNPSPFVYTNAFVRFLCFVIYFYFFSNSIVAAGLALTLPVLLASLISQMFVPFGFMRFRSHVSAGLMKMSFRGATPIFFSNVATIPYTHGGLLLLSYFHGPIAAGLYAAADRLIKPIVSVQGVIFQAAYPLACRADNKVKVTSKPLVMAYSVTALAIISVWLFADQIISTIYSAEFMASASTLRVLATVLLLSPLAMASAQIWLMACGYGSKASRAYLSSSMCYCLIGPVVIFQYSYTGAAAALLVAELISTVLLLCFVKKVQNG